MSAAGYLRSRGFSDATIIDLGWSIGPLKGDARRYALPAGVRVWRIPYRTAGRLASFERVRLIDDADIERYGGGKYRQPARTRLRPYDPDGHLERGALNRLLVIEGEANAASVRQTLPGLPVIGLPGKAGLKAHHLEGRLVRHAVVWLWLDLDEQGSEQAQTRLADLIASANTTDLRLVGDTAGLDANDMLREFGTERAAEQVRRTLEQATPAVTQTRLWLPPRPWITQPAPELQRHPSLSPRRQVPENPLALPQASSDLPVYSAAAEAQLEREGELAYDEDAVRAAAALFGMRLDEPSACVLHGHRGSAVIRRDPGLQQFLYFESGCGGRAEGRTLADVRAAIAYGHLVPLSGIAAWCWYARLFSEANRDLIIPAHAELPPLPDWATDELRLLADGFLLHLQLRWREPEYQGQPVAFARPFAAAWSSLVSAGDPQNMLTYRLLGELERKDIIRRAEPAGRSFTYLPGKGLTRRSRSRPRRGGPA